MKINRVAIVSIPVSDQQAAKDFYVEILGFVVVRENPMDSGQSWIELAPEGAETSIVLVNWFKEMPPGSVRGLVIDTDDVEDAHETLTDRGLEISELEEEEWGKYATFSDPDGNGWILQQAALWG